MQHRAPGLNPLFFLLFCLLTLLVLVSPVGAQESNTPTETASAIAPEDMTPEMISDMVARMSDEEVRQMLLDRLDGTEVEETAVETVRRGLFGSIREGWLFLYGDAKDAVLRLPRLVSGQIEAVGNFASSFGGAGLVSLFGLLALAIGVGLALEFAVKFVTRGFQAAPLPDDEDPDLGGSVKFLFSRFVRELAGLVGFYIGLRIMVQATMTPEQLSFATPALTYLVWFPRLGMAISRLVLAPESPRMRLVNCRDRWAKYLHRNLEGLILLIGFVLFIISFNETNGVPLAETRIGFWLNLAIHIYVGVIAWTARDGLVDMMRGTDPDRTGFDEAIAQAYPYFAVAVAGVMWLVVEMVIGFGNPQLLTTGPHFMTMFWLLMAPALDTLVRGLVRHLQPPMIGEGAVAEKAYKSTKRSFIRIGRVIMAGIIILLIANAWQIDLFTLTGETEGIGSKLFQFILTLAIGYVLFELVGLWINRHLAREQTSRVVSEDEAQGEGGGAGGSRLATVLPLARVTAQVAIAVIFILLAIGSLGIDITPLLAGAGILGLAIGFGAQKLVSDVVSGVFFLIDDAFRVGEYVEVDGTMGTVEKISIRSMQLRHHRGPVHTIPYGEIPKLTNYSRDWVIMKLKFTVPFDTDPNKVKKIFKTIGAEMAEDPLFKDDFLQPFKSQGVLDFDDVGMVIRGKFMAKPGTQFTIRKEVFNRVKRAFDEAGIDFARREVRVAMPETHHNEPLSEAETAAIEAAASAAAQQDAQKTGAT